MLHGDNERAGFERRIIFRMCRSSLGKCTVRRQKTVQVKEKSSN